MLAYGASGGLAYAALVFIGFSIGAEIDFMTFLASRYFGITQFGEIYGILFASLLLGTSIGPICFGWSFESSGSYIYILWIAAAASAVAALMSSALPRYPSSSQAAQDPGARQ